MDLHIITALLAGVLSFTVSFWVYTKDRKNRLNQLFFALNFCIAIWNFADVVITKSPNIEKALFFDRISYLGAFFIPLFYAKVIFGFIGITNNYKKLYFYSYISIFFLIIVNFTSLFIKSVSINPFKEDIGYAYLIFVIYFLYLIFYSLYVLIKNYKKEVSLLKKIQLLYVLIGFGFVLVGGCCYFLTLIIPNFPVVHYILEMCYVVTFAYAIIARNLMAVDLAWRKLAKNITHVLIFAGYFFGISFYLQTTKLDYSWKIIILFSASWLAIELTSHRLKNWLERLFLGKYKKVWDRLQKDIKIKSDMFDLLTVVNILIYDIPEILKLSYSAYYQFNQNAQKFLILETNNRDYYSVKQSPEILLDNKIIEKLNEIKSYLYVEKLRKDERNKEIVQEMEKLKLDIIYPFFVENILVDVLVYSKKNEEVIFHSEDLEILGKIINTAQSQVFNIDIVKKISAQTAEEVLRDYKNNYQVKLLSETKKLDKVREAPLLCSESQEILNKILTSSDFNIYLYDQIDKDNKKYVCQTTPEMPTIKENNSLIKTLSYTKNSASINEILLIENIQKAVDRIQTPELVETFETLQNVNARIVIPFLDFKLLGFLVISDKAGKEQKYTYDDFFSLNLICDKIKSTLSNIYANQKANRDGLTGFYVKDLMYEKLADEVYYCARNINSVTIGMIDFDNFKLINDNISHVVGDKCLKLAALTLRSLLRPEDECFRFGGEEFVIIFKETNLEKAKCLAERLNKDFNDSEIIKSLQKEYNIKITISIGLCVYQPEKEIDYDNAQIKMLVDSMVKTADDALVNYAKKNGKNRACLGEVIV